MGNTAHRLLMFVLLIWPVVGQTDGQIESVQLEHLKHWGYSTVSWNPNWRPVAAEDVERLESQLRADPEDVGARVRLLNYYWHKGLRQQRASAVFWLIDNHPESPILGLDIAWLFPGDRDPADHYRAMHDPADFIKARVLWDAVIARHLDTTPEALHNAARFFETVDQVRSEGLAKRLQEVDPAGHGKVVSTFLTQILPGLHH
jgi:hypothetical protein